MNSKVIAKAIYTLGRLPGIGERSAQRIVLTLIQQKDFLLSNLIKTLELLAQEIKVCHICNNIDEQSPCAICSSNTRNKKLLCVVEDVGSLWALEGSKAFMGTYFVLGSTVKAANSEDFEQSKLPQLLQIIRENKTEEVVLANSLTVEGQATSLYLREEIAAVNPNIKVSTLAQGVPVGGEIDYLDELTLQTAINLRRNID